MAPYIRCYLLTSKQGNKIVTTKTYLSTVLSRTACEIEGSSHQKPALIVGQNNSKTAKAAETEIQ